MSTSRSFKKSLARAVNRPFEPAVLALARKTAEQYQVAVWFDTAEGHFCGRCVEMPLIFGTGEDANECVRDTRELTASAIALMIEQGQVAPLPQQARAQRTEQVNVRLTPAEKRKIESAAGRKGFRGLSDYLRAAALTDD